MRVNLPAWIHETERPRKESLADVKPHRPPCPGQLSPECPGLDHVAPNCPVRLKPDCNQAKRQGKSEEWQSPEDVPPLDASAPPPGAAQQHEGHHDHRSLGQQRQQERGEGEEIEPRCVLRVACCRVLTLDFGLWTLD